MSTIRTAALAVGTHTSAPTTVVIATVPPGEHWRLTELALSVTMADTVTVFCGSSSGPALRLVATDPVFAGAGTQAFELRRVLESGDTITLTGIAAGNVVVWWLSGTRYED